MRVGELVEPILPFGLAKALPAYDYDTLSIVGDGEARRKFGFDIDKGSFNIVGRDRK